MKTQERIGSNRRGNTGRLEARILTWLKSSKGSPPERSSAATIGVLRTSEHDGAQRQAWASSRRGPPIFGSSDRHGVTPGLAGARRSRDSSAVRAMCLNAAPRRQAETAPRQRSLVLEPGCRYGAWSTPVATARGAGRQGPGPAGRDGAPQGPVGLRTERSGQRDATPRRTACAGRRLVHGSPAQAQLGTAREEAATRPCRGHSAGQGLAAVPAGVSGPRRHTERPRDNARSHGPDRWRTG